MARAPADAGLALRPHPLPPFETEAVDLEALATGR